MPHILFEKKELDLGIEVVCLDNLSSSDIKNIEEFNKYWISTRLNGEDKGIAMFLEPTPNFFLIL